MPFRTQPYKHYEQPILTKVTCYVHLLQISMASYMAILDVIHFLSLSFSIYLWYKSKMGKGFMYILLISIIVLSIIGHNK